MEQDQIDKLGIGIILNKIGRCQSIKVETQTGDNRQFVDGYIQYKSKNYFFQLKSTSTNGNTLVSDAYFNFAYQNDVLIYFYVCDLENEEQEKLYFSIIDKNWIDNNYIVGKTYYLDIPSIQRKEGTKTIKTQLFSVTKFENAIRNYFNKSLCVKKNLKPGTYNVTPIIATKNVVANIFNENIGIVESLAFDKERFPFRMEHEIFSKIFLSHNCKEEHIYEYDGKICKAIIENDVLQYSENDNKAIRCHINDNIIDIILYDDNKIEFQLTRWKMGDCERVISFFKSVLKDVPDIEYNFFREIYGIFSQVVGKQELFYFANINNTCFMFCNLGNDIYRNINPNGTENIDAMAINIAHAFIEANDSLISKLLSSHPDLVKSIINTYSSDYYFSPQIIKRAKELNILVEELYNS